MPTYKDLFPDKWLKAEVINGYRPRVTIEHVAIEQLFNPRTKKNEQKLVVKFYKKDLRLICNKTQATALATICKTNDYSRWPGHEVVLSTGKAPNGADTILISPVPDAPKPAPQAMQEQPPIDDENDLLDVDEDGPAAPAVDESLWEPNAPVTSAPNRISPVQMTRLHVLGTDAYGKGWDAERAKLVSEVTSGAATSAKELTPQEADVLIKQLEAELRYARNGKVAA